MQLLTLPPLSRLHELSAQEKLYVAPACGEGLEKEHRWKGTPLSHMSSKVEARAKSSSADCRISEEGRASSDQRRVSLVLKVLIHDS